MDDNSDDPRYGHSDDEESIEQVRKDIRHKKDTDMANYATGSDIRAGADGKNQASAFVISGEPDERSQSVRHRQVG